VIVGYTFAGVSVLFLTAGVLRLVRDKGGNHPQSRTWLVVGLIFGIVASWLLY
jgi:hypothetical protein